jgi:hypothetical protein
MASQSFALNKSYRDIKSVPLGAIEDATMTANIAMRCCCFLRANCIRPEVIQKISRLSAKHEILF